MHNALLSFIVFAAGITACKVNNNGNPGNAAPGSPVETKKPNTDYQPAFAGQTRIMGVKTKTPYEAKIISSELTKPWAVVGLPDGRLLITEKEGNLRIAKANGELSAPITGLPAVNSKGQGGLLDVALANDFSTSRTIYFSFTENRPGGNLTALGKGRLSNDERRVENAQVIYRAIPAYDGDKHFGGRIQPLADGTLYLSTGERSDLATRPKAQTLDNALGKIVHLNANGPAVPNGPFAGQAGALPEIFSYGHRNVQSLAIHPVTGDLWSVEMGPRGGDEVNVTQRGKNYGWPTITYGIEYSGKTIGAGITHKVGMEQPVYYWDPVVSPSGMMFYNSDVMPEWKNNLFIGALSGQHIVRLVIENNKVVGEERLLANEGQRFRDVGQGRDGAIYAVTDEGRLYRIAKK